MLTLAVLLAAAVVAGTPLRVVALPVVGWWSPPVALVAVAALVLAGSRRNGRPLDVEAVWCGAMAAELRAGSSLRQAVEAASARVPELDLDHVGRLARSGVPISRLVDDIATAMPHMRTLVGPALRIAAESGAAATGVFGRLAVRSLQEVEDDRERRVATTQVRLSAMVIGSLPVVVLAGLVVSGRAATLLAAGGLGVAALAIGVALQACGVALVWLLSYRVAT